MSANVRHSSATNEHYTPAHVVELARQVLGGIVLDPFSSDEAQEVVMATAHWTLAGARAGGCNGFTSQYGNVLTPSTVFENSPGGSCDDAGFPIVDAKAGVAKCEHSGSCGLPAPHEHVGRHSAQKRAWQKLVAEREAGRVSAAVFVCFSLELLQTSQVDAVGPLPTDFPTCYPRTRLRYVQPGGEVGKSPPHASCVVYLPPIAEWDAWAAERPHAGDDREVRDTVRQCRESGDTVDRVTDSFLGGPRRGRGAGRLLRPGRSGRGAAPDILRALLGAAGSRL